MLNLEMLPAAHGDCLWIEYGDGKQTRRILIDGGPAHTYPALRARMLHLPPESRRFELLVLTHIVGDHIEGILRLRWGAPSRASGSTAIRNSTRFPIPRGRHWGCSKARCWAC